MTAILWIGAFLFWAIALTLEAPLYAYAIFGLVWGAGCSFIANWQEYGEVVDDDD